MSLQRRQVLSLFLGSAAISALSACGGKQTTTTPPPPTETPSPSSTPTPSWLGASKQGGGQLTLLSALLADPESQQRFANDVLNGFFSGSSYTLDTTYTSPDRLLDSIYTGLVGADLADLVMPPAGWVPGLQRRNALREIPESVIADLHLDDHFLISCRQQASVRALPYAIDLSLVGYRSDLFAQAGISSPPATLDELRALAKQLTTPELSGFDPFGPGLRNTWLTLLGSYGGQLFTSDGKPQFDRDEGLKALEFIVGLVKDGSADPSKIPATGSPQLFFDKKAAMTLVSSTNWPALSAAGLAESSHLGLFAMPAAQQGKDPCVLQTGTLLAVSNQSQHPDVAFEFCHYALGASPLLAAARITSAVPARPDIVPGSDLALNRVLVQGLDDVKYAVMVPGGSPAWLDVDAVIESELMAAVTGKQPASASISNLSRVANDSLDHG
ncbi:multiple sugar transport system substrate-binding protein [Propionibacterium cyclohexanicum]|uniref:Multiple sugar transport system substrate-binding protein n=1 Tax=Propionibacterium cyclohexanicum TaxID=64702 RepID=A0A1H9RRX9_9ACTN|nr:extracellular solute-binding protein [Propionibacterium cyclohexanicum]SER74883.1 multiple sugar transport system substrate-binding protein [Propionibacterium cyclohexanicum]